MVLKHRISITQEATPTTPLPPSESAIVIIGTGTGAPSGDLVAYNTPAAIRTVDEALEAFAAGTILDAVTYIESVVDVTCYCIRYNDTLTGAQLTTAINGAIDLIPRVAIGQAIQPTFLSLIHI